MQLTMHLRIQELQGTFTARALIFYTESLEDITEGDQITGLPARQIVDQKDVTFQIED